MTKEDVLNEACKSHERILCLIDPSVKHSVVFVKSNGNRVDPFVGVILSDGEELFKISKWTTEGEPISDGIMDDIVDMMLENVLSMGFTAATALLKKKTPTDG